MRGIALIVLLLAYPANAQVSQTVDGATIQQSVTAIETLERADYLTEHGYTTETLKTAEEQAAKADDFYRANMAKGKK